LGLGGSEYEDILQYLLSGGRHLDGAMLYGNAAAAGKAIQKAMRKGVRREDIFFTHKIGGAFMGFDGVQWVIPKLLQESQLEYFDLVLVHGPRKELKRCGTPSRCRQETWLSLQRFQDMGVVRHLGVSNFGPRQIKELQDLKGAPVEVNQIEYHPWVMQSHRDAVVFCHSHRIAVTAYASVRGSQAATPEEVVELERMAATYNKTVSQVLLRWAIQKNVSVIPHTKKLRHMLSNMEVASFTLNEKHMARLDKMPPNLLTQPQNRLDGDDYPPAEWGPYSLDDKLPEVEKQLQIESRQELAAALQTSPRTDATLQWCSAAALTAVAIGLLRGALGSRRPEY